MVSRWPRETVLRTLQALSERGLLHKVLPALLLVPEFRAAVSDGPGGPDGFPDLPAGSYEWPGDATQQAMDVIASYVQANTEMVCRTSNDLASLPVAMSADMTPVDYFTRRSLGERFFRTDIRFDVGGTLKMDSLRVNISRQLDLSGTYSLGELRVGLDTRGDLSLGLGGGLSFGKVDLGSISATTNFTELLSGTANLRASITAGPLRGTMTIEVSPGQGLYNVGEAMVRDFYNYVLFTSGSPFRLTTSGWTMQ